jgi:hypothetical protein
MRRFKGKTHKENISEVNGKRQILNALDVQIVAVPEKIKIRIAVPLEFITTGRTSA